MEAKERKKFSIVQWIVERSSGRFRTKFMLVASLGVLIALASSAGTALYNVTRLEQEASAEVYGGLARANDEYLENYIETTALRLDLLFEQTFSELRMTASMFQTLIDNPEAAEAIGNLPDQSSFFKDDFQVDPNGKWTQNKPGEQSVISVWHYMLEKDGSIKPEILKDVKKNAIFDLFGPAIWKNGSEKLQVYYVGSKERPIMRLTPWLEMAQTFDRLYPGHTDKNFWDSFFPGIYEGWQRWLKDPSSKPVAKTDVTGYPPYIDAATGGNIVTFFNPLWTKDRTDCAGAVAIDVTLDQAVALIRHVHIKSTGFAFMSMSDSNVLAINSEGEKVLGIGTRDGQNEGVKEVKRLLSQSQYPEVAKIAMPSSEKPVFHRVSIQRAPNEPATPYVIVLRRLPGMNFYRGEKPIGMEYWVLGFVVPESELFSTVHTAQRAIQSTAGNILGQQIIVVVLSLFAVLVGIAWVARRITANLVDLSEAAHRLMNKDYSMRVNIDSQDEIGRLGMTFNAMASDIERYTANLEELVSERTMALEKANEEISELNAKLAQENIRLGAELNVARQLQLMVLPAPSELQEIPGLDIAGYMAPADEVGGDYYDVLRSDGLVKIGIGDVTGHGLESGVLMLMVQTAVRTLLAANERDPKKFLSIVNKVIYQNIQRIRSDKNLSLTLLDYSDGQLQLTGQHEDLIIVRKDGTLDRVETMGLGLPIGIDLDISDFIGSIEVKLEPGDVVTLFSDGITEAEDSAEEQYGIDRLCQVISRNHERTSREIKDAIIEDVLAHVGYNKIHDDITVLVIKRV
ncbi:PP2C family protein-serine/threonine phosphatase [Sorangium sp. So ce1078]|uniref:PP2C family protein-serine/threonine phosphatase n=1 Tax=Sorangium sp. So ce1078 TaxID=3133329 RepID=UPI003F619D30